MTISLALTKSLISSNQEAAVKIQESSSSRSKILPSWPEELHNCCFSFPPSPSQSASLAAIKMTQEGGKKKKKQSNDLVNVEMQTTLISTTEKYQLSVPANQVSPFLSHLHPLQTLTSAVWWSGISRVGDLRSPKAFLKDPKQGTSFQCQSRGPSTVRFSLPLPCNPP